MSWYTLWGKKSRSQTPDRTGSSTSEDEDPMEYSIPYSDNDQNGSNSSEEKEKDKHENMEDTSSEEEPMEYYVPYKNTNQIGSNSSKEKEKDKHENMEVTSSDVSNHMTNSDSGFTSTNISTAEYIPMYPYLEFDDDDEEGLSADESISETDIETDVDGSNNEDLSSVKVEAHSGDYTAPSAPTEEALLCSRCRRALNITDDNGQIEDVDSRQDESAVDNGTSSPTSSIMQNTENTESASAPAAPTNNDTAEPASSSSSPVVDSPAPAPAVNENGNDNNKTNHSKNKSRKTSRPISSEGKGNQKAKTPKVAKKRKVAKSPTRRSTRTRRETQR